MRNQFSRFALAATLGLALAFTLSCGDSSSGGGGGGGGSIDAGPIIKEKISGTCEKGPFSQGATVKIYELNENLEKTSNFFWGTTDSKGNYEIEIKSGKLASPYIALEVSGRYASEVSGQQTAGSITLNAVADVSNKSTANINVLTHLEYNKVIELAQSGQTFDDAKKTAQQEVFSALGISAIEGKSSDDLSLFGKSASDSVLLVASVLLQGNRSAEEVSNLLADLDKEIQYNDGTLSDALKSEIANSLADVDLDKVKENILSLNPEAKAPELEDIKNVVSSIDSTATLPTEKPSSSSVGLSSSGGEQPIVTPSSSSIGSTPYVPPYTPPSNPTVVIPSSSSNNLYCKWADSECPNHCCLLETPDAKDPGDNPYTYKEACIEWSDGLFNNATCSGTPIAGGFSTCGSERYNPSTQFCYTDTADGSKHAVDLCGGHEFDPREQLCKNSSILNRCGENNGYNPQTQFCGFGGIPTTLCGGNPYDSRVSECSGGTVRAISHCNASDYTQITIGTQVWMKENLNCDKGSGSICNWDNHDNCKEYGRLYNLATAQTACPTGWHLPTLDEWKKLFEYIEPNCVITPLSNTGCDVVGKKLKSTSGWATTIPEGSMIMETPVGSGIDTYGFSALPGGSKDVANHSCDEPGHTGCEEWPGHSGFWWSSDGEYAILISTFSHAVSPTGINSSTSDDYFLSVRCVKN